MGSLWRSCVSLDGYQAKPGYAVPAVNNSGPCGYYVAPLSPGHTITYTPLTGAAMNVCSLGGVPAGYVEVLGPARPSGGACGYSIAPVSNDLITITPAA